ncbi:ATPase MORC2A-like isoform X2 [Physella acuta]|uniref:ATPase MORC2A-like isoform X2 n=1 Tax=Physella acuta TaxID=109671 RepID=UPI0027DBF22E|nr:ATPase MORC2A-like isoform X2 [Physella acuta]
MASTVGIPLSKVSPAFLHANSTSHTWVFSAFAELIDNAYDPDVSASELLIDQVDIRDTPCLIFLDNGAGMDRDHLLKMLSFGFCEKDIYERQGSHQPIGHYGNGFKSGSMRIGNDALVFTRSQRSASIGFLSQTFLKSIQTDCVVVPILEYRLPKLERIKSQESRNNLNAILQYSVFKHEEELKAELRALEGSKTGTKIIIYNLKRLQDGTYELDFSSDPTDIRSPEAHEVDMTSVYHRPIQHNSSEYKRSLREYCSILFLRPRMKITIRGIRVKSKLISKSLSNTEIDMYKPTWLSRPVKIIFGFSCEKDKSEDYGMMLYHRNRLIKAFEKVGYQKQPNELGIGVVGVAQVDFLQPIHNKQDFNKDEKFNSVMSAFATKLNEYWNEKRPQLASPQQQAHQRNLPDWLWAQCDQCLKWRRLPDGIDGNSLPEQWYCRMNADATHNRCDIPEEPEDEDLAVRPTYEKTQKRIKEERKRQRMIELEKEDEIKRRRIMEKERELKEKEAQLRAIHHVTARSDNITLTSLQKELAASRQREEQQKRLIQQIQEQNKKMAESLKVIKENKAEGVPALSGPFLSSTPAVSANKPKPQASTPVANTRTTRQQMKIKTESGEVLSITQNDVDDDDDDQYSESPLVPKTKEVLKISTSFIQNSKSTSAVNGTVKKVPDGSAPSKSRKRNKVENVVAVIDLTGEREFGELVDIKPDLDVLRVTLQESLRKNLEDIKPDKEALDAAMANKDDVAKKKPPNENLLAETKQEITETLQPSSSNSDKPQPSVNGDQSGAADEDFVLDIPDSLNDNIEAAMAAIKDCLEKEKSAAGISGQNPKPEVPEQSDNPSHRKSNGSDSSLESISGIFENPEDVGISKFENDNTLGNNNSVEEDSLANEEDDDNIVFGGSDDACEDDSDYRGSTGVDEKGDKADRYYRSTSDGDDRGDKPEPGEEHPVGDRQVNGDDYSSTDKASDLTASQSLTQVSTEQLQAAVGLIASQDGDSENNPEEGENNVSAGGQDLRVPENDFDIGEIDFGMNGNDDDDVEMLSEENGRVSSVNTSDSGSAEKPATVTANTDVGFLDVDSENCEPVEDNKNVNGDVNDGSSQSCLEESENPSEDDSNVMASMLTFNNLNAVDTSNADNVLTTDNEVACLEYDSDSCSNSAAAQDRTASPCSPPASLCPASPAFPSPASPSHSEHSAAADINHKNNKVIVEEKMEIVSKEEIEEDSYRSLDNGSSVGGLAVCNIRNKNVQTDIDVYFLQSDLALSQLGVHKLTTNVYTQTESDHVSHIEEACHSPCQDDLKQKYSSEPGSQDKKLADLPSLGKVLAEAEVQTDVADIKVEGPVEESDLHMKLSEKNKIIEIMQEQQLQFQRNVHQLLGYIVSDVDIGEVSNIENLVKDMIKVNKDSQLQTNADSQLPSDADSQVQSTEDSHSFC